MSDLARNSAAIWLLVVLSPLLLTTSGLHGSDEAIDLHLLPKADSPVVATLGAGASASLLRVSGEWAELRLGQVQGWAPLDQIWSRWEKLERQTPKSFFQNALQPQLPELASRPGSFEELLDFALSSLRDRQLQRADPLGRHRTQGFFGQWGPFFYRRTSLYSWRGFRVAQFWDDRIGLNLVKGKLNYDALTNACGSEAALEAALKEQGVLDRSLLGRRRSLFLELRYSF